MNNVSADIPIWSDADVQRIYDVREGRPFPRFYIFNDDPFQLRLITQFVEADQHAGSDGPAESFLAVCLAGIRAVEELPADVDAGWRKFLVYMIDMNNHFLWDLYHRDEVAAIAEWTVETIERYGWGPDGNSTALGQRHGNAMALAAKAGGGLRRDPKTGKFVYGDGDAARRLAGASGYRPGEASANRMADPATPPQQVLEQAAELASRAEAAKAGDRASQVFMAALGAKVAGDAATALKLFEEAAQIGDVQAMIEAGDGYAAAGSVGVARSWFERAVAAGSSEAFGHIARLAEAAGDEQGEREWSRKGADAGDAWCMGNYAYFRLLDAQQASGKDIGPILAETYSYAVRAAHLGQVNAMYSAGLASAFLGRGDEARDWLLRADEAHHPNARPMMRKLGLG
jgi:hypothetical protein